jgi:hypothetical protein|tara:strand:+ start:5336 stop:5479 length:144 start_codon:yes stop_codon:yes gene_type:complete
MVELIQDFVENAMPYLDINVSVQIIKQCHGKEQMYSIKENGTKAKLL